MREFFCKWVWDFYANDRGGALFFVYLEIKPNTTIMKDVLLWMGAGQIGMAIARRVGYDKRIVVGDRSIANAEAAARTLCEAGFDCLATEADLSSRDSILSLIDTARSQGEISTLINAAGVSPSQAPVETILRVDLYGTAVLLEEVGRVIKRRGTGVTISSQSGHRCRTTPERSRSVHHRLRHPNRRRRHRLILLRPPCDHNKQSRLTTR